MYALFDIEESNTFDFLRPSSKLGTPFHNGFLLPKPHLLITLIRAETMSFLPRLTTTRASVGLADGGNITLSLLLQMRLLICMIAFTGTESLVGGGGDDGEYLMTSGTFSNSSFFHRFFSLHL
jgi:hypothetical protein